MRSVNPSSQRLRQRLAEEGLEVAVHGKLSHHGHWLKQARRTGFITLFEQTR